MASFKFLKNMLSWQGSPFTWAGMKGNWEIEENVYNSRTWKF